MKKVLTALLTLAMFMALCVTSFAAETFTVTINQENEGHIYQAYQIFIGDLSTDEEGDLVLANIAWGSGVTEDGKTALGDAQAKADTLVDADAAEAFAEEVAAYLTKTSTEATYVEADGNYVIKDLPAGYYLIMDKEGSLDETPEHYTSYILKVVGNVEADPKDGETTTTKKVDDTNNSTEATNEIEWHDSADHDIGDLIDFKLEATITDDYAKYDSYFFAFHDTEDKGLTFQPDSVKVYVDGVQITSDFELIKEGCTDGCTFEIRFADLKKIAAVKAGSVITVEYQSMLNEEAVPGNQGNVNKVFGEFSNNPNGEGHGKTPDDTVIVFTYTTKVNKVDSNNAPLTGAKFTLEKFVASATGTETYAGILGNWTKITQVAATAGDKFEFRGIDDGYYRLTEDEAPVGYNKIDPINFHVTAEHDVVWETQARTDVLTKLTGNVQTGEITFSTNTATGELSTDVVNKRGLELPETGGIGTTIFYVVGAVLVVGAVVFLITKKRMSK